MFTTPAGFAQLTHLLMGLAEGKLILCMEVGDCLLPLGSGVLEGTTTGLIRLARIAAPSLSQRAVCVQDLVFGSNFPKHPARSYT